MLLLGILKLRSHPTTFSFDEAIITLRHILNALVGTRLKKADQIDPPFLFLPHPVPIFIYGPRISTDAFR